MLLGQEKVKMRRVENSSNAAVKPRDYSRGSKKIIEVCSDMLILIFSIMLSAVMMQISFIAVLGISLLLGAVDVIFLLLFGYYRVKIDRSSLELVSAALKAAALTLFISESVNLIFRYTSFWYIFLLLTYFSVFSLGIRYIFLIKVRSRMLESAKNYPRALIYGAGEIGQTLIRQYYAGKLHYDIIALVDDSENLKRTSVLGIPVLGTKDDISSLLSKTKSNVLIIAIADLPESSMDKAVEEARKADASIMIVPSLFEIQNGSREFDLRNVDYKDLLGRNLIEIDKTPIKDMVQGRTVLVTGACGSIGSEISRQLVALGVERLIMVDIDESALHDMGLRLTGYKEEINDKIIPILADIKNKDKIDRIFRQYRPEIVYHAAAYKHVPMGEREPDEIIKTNVLGSFNVLSAAKNAGVRKVVIISTDKAVNPTNVMGASKRMVELIASSLTSTETEIVAVRFGNVLGSRGSMLPLFIEQIKAGVPITVTHKDIIRYFMAIPEAVSLVLKAGAMAKGGEVMVLDMGKPVRIYDFAKKLVKYYGDENSSIVVTGLRPGEKLYEELLAKEDTTIPTDDKLVFKAKLNDHKLDEIEFKDFIKNIDSYTDLELEGKLESFVPEFQWQHSNVLLKNKIKREDGI